MAFPLSLGSPAQLVNKAFNASPVSDGRPFNQKLSSPFTPAAAYTNHAASPKGLFGSPLNMQHQVTPPAAAKAPSSQQQTPDCPPPVLLGADSVPRFPTPQYSPAAFPRMSPASPLPDSDARGRSVEKGRSVLGRLRSKSRSGQRPTPPEDRKPAPATRERRFSISDRISSVLKRKPKAEQETPPPLPTSSRVKVSASSTKLAVQGTPQRTLARSASSPNLSRKQSWQIESRLPPLPAFGEAFALGALTYTSPTLPSLRPSFHTPPTIDTGVRRPIDVEPDSPSSVPSLSPSSSQSVSFGASSQSNLHTPSLPSPTSFPANATDSPDRDEVLHHFYPFGSPLAPLEESVYGQPMSLTATPQGMEMQSGRGSTFDSPRTGASDDMPLAMLKQRREAAAASRPAPFQFVSAEMSKKPLKKGRSTPNLRAEPFRRPPSIPATPYLGHSLLPQSDDGVKARVGAARPLPVFVEQSVLALAT